MVADAVRKLPEANVARLTRFLIMLAFAGAVLAAYGLQRWLSGIGAGASADDVRDGRRAAIVPPLFWIATASERAVGSRRRAGASCRPSHYGETSAGGRRAGLGVALGADLRARAGRRWRWPGGGAGRRARPSPS